MSKIQDEYQRKDFSARFSKEFRRTQSKKSEILMLSILIILLTALVVISFIAKDSHFSYIGFLLLAVCYVILIAIPLIWILVKITIRTKNFDFAFQAFVYSQTVMVIFIAATRDIPLFENQLNSIKLLVDLIIYLAPLAFFIQIRMFRKSILRNDEINVKNASIVLSQSLQIEEEQNGFSERPIFTQYQELEALISSPTDFKTQFEKYCVFMGKKGELIDWHVTEDRAILYPRFLIRSPNIIKSPFRFINFMKAVRSKTDLTTIEISYSTKQIFIKVAFSDYNVLNREVTFHSLALSILETLKLSANAFFSNDLESAYSLLINMSE